MRRRPSALLLLASAPLPAQVAGPPAPTAARRTPAEAAIAAYRAAHGERPLPAPCRGARGDEITVCGTPDGLSPYRVPLPAERGAREGPRTAIGELPRAGAGGSPVHAVPATGVTLTLSGDGTRRLAPNGREP